MHAETAAAAAAAAANTSEGTWRAGRHAYGCVSSSCDRDRELIDREREDVGTDRMSSCDRDRQLIDRERAAVRMPPNTTTPAPLLLLLTPASPWRTHI